MDVTFISVVVVVASGILLCGLFGYFLYQKRQTIQVMDNTADRLVLTTGETMHFDTPWEAARNHGAKWEAGAKNLAATEHFHEHKFVAAVNVSPSSHQHNEYHEENHDMNTYEAESNDDFLILYLSADSGKAYTGYELLRAILSAGLRYDTELKIFQRYERLHARGQPLFSLAQATEAGKFDLNKMGEVVCKGLCLFLNLSEIKDPLVAFEKMVDTAYQLIDELGGEIKDMEGRILNHEILTQLRSHVQSRAVA